MTKLLRKIFIIGVVLIAVLFVYNIVKFTINQNNYSYKIITGKDNRFDSLFKIEELDDLSVRSVFGNEYEQIYFYDYLEVYQVIIWNINGFSNVDLTENHLFTIDNFDDIVFYDKNYTNFGRYMLTSKLSPLELNVVNMYTEKGMILINHDESKLFSYMDLYSTGIVIGDGKNYLLRIESKESVHYNIGFINGQNGFQLIVLSKKKNAEIDNDLFFKLFNVPEMPHD